MVPTTKHWTISLTSFDLDRRTAIVGLGGVTPVGRTALAAAAAVRAGLSGFSEHPFMGDSESRPVHVAQCSWLEPSVTLEGRISTCLIGAIREALHPVRSGGDCPELALLVNLPPDRPGLPASISATIHSEIQRVLHDEFGSVSVARLGHAGGLFAVRSALELMARDPNVACVVAGADSYIDLETLEWIEDTERLHGAGERNNAWGFIPGEGAGAVLLMSSEATQSAGLHRLGAVHGIGVARETQLNGTGAVCTGEGLTAAIRGATAGFTADRRLSDVYCDMNGEPYRADEYGFAVSRLREHFVSASEFHAPADCWGDVGAASALLGIVLACIADLKGYAAGVDALVWASSDGGERGAAVIRAGTGG
jgi:3-oxoacyl-[acyl-carrier-protein] synthase-1